MGRSKRNVFWTVPVWTDDTNVSGPGISNVGGPDILVGLLDAVDYEDRPVFIKRIIGQYNHAGNASGVLASIIHHRIYVANTDLATGAVDAGTLDTALGAERAFLWHEVGFLPGIQSGSLWQGMGPTTGSRTQFQRGGAFDISVGRKIHGTDSLIWHSFVGAVAADNEYNIQLWIRILLEEV